MKKFLKGLFDKDNKWRELDWVLMTLFFMMAVVIAAITFIMLYHDKLIQP